MQELKSPEESMHPSRSAPRPLRLAPSPSPLHILSVGNFLLSFGIFLLSVGVFMVSVGAAAGAPAPRSVPLALRAPVDPSLKINQRFLSTDARGGPMVDLFIEGDVSPDALRAKGIEVNTVAGGIVTARCPLGVISRL